MGESHLRMDAIELRQQHDALLLVRIRAGNNRNTALRRAEVIGQMRHTGRDVDKVPGPSREAFFESLAIPHAGFAAQDIDGGFVTIVLVRLRPSTGWNGHHLQLDSLRIYRFGRDPGRRQKRLLANEFCTGTANPTVKTSLFRRNYLNITKCFEAFLTELHCKTRILIGTGWNEKISNTMLVNPYRPGFQLTGNSAERSRITAPNGSR